MPIVLDKRKIIRRSKFNILRLAFYENPEFRNKSENIRPSKGLAMGTDNLISFKASQGKLNE